MVRLIEDTILYKASVLLALLLLATNLHSQDKSATDFSVFNTYGSWGINFTPLLFNKAKVTRDYGNIVLNSNPLLPFKPKFGLTKRFFKDKEWSIISGVHFLPMSFYNVSFVIDKNDLDFDSSAGINFKEESSGFYFLSIPILAEHKIQMGSNLFFNSNIGFVISYIQSSGVGLSVGYISEPDNQDITFFYIDEGTSRGYIKLGGIASIGFYLLHKKFMLKIDIEYRHNFKPLLEGEYTFFNLLQSPDTGGEFVNSNNYFGLSTTVFFKKRKKKKRRKKLNGHPFFN